MSNATISAHRRQFLGGGALALATVMARRRALPSST